MQDINNNQDLYESNCRFKKKSIFNLKGTGASDDYKNWEFAR